MQFCPSSLAHASHLFSHAITWLFGFTGALASTTFSFIFFLVDGNAKGNPTSPRGKGNGMDGLIFRQRILYLNAFFPRACVDTSEFWAYLGI